MNTRLIGRLLVGEGFIVHVAHDGDSALASIREDPPDVIILDVLMPGIDGFEVCRQVKQDPATALTPVILLTGLGDREHRIAGINAGADDFLFKPFDAEELQARVRSLVRLKRQVDELESAESVILSLARTVEARDPYTEGHCERLSAYATALGAELGLGTDDLNALHRGGYLHDVGKIGIPDAVLLKPAPLTADEYDTIKGHALIGETLCGSLRSLAAVRPIVRGHHERIDGSGYPDALRGDAVPLLAQIVGLVDVFDALTTTRPYRAALAVHDSCDRLGEAAAAGQFRRELVEVFTRLVKAGRFERD